MIFTSKRSIGSSLEEFVYKNIVLESIWDQIGFHYGVLWETLMVLLGKSFRYFMDEEALGFGDFHKRN